MHSFPAFFSQGHDVLFYTSISPIPFLFTNTIYPIRFLSYCTTREKPRVAPGTLARADGEEEDEEEELVSWRNTFAMVNFLRVLQFLTKNQGTRIRLLLQYKAHATLRKVLDFEETEVQKYALKVCKSMVPFVSRKWRHINMHIISGIYMQCPQGLRDDWLMGGEMEILEEEARVSRTLGEMEEMKRGFTDVEDSKVIYGGREGGRDDPEPLFPRTHQAILPLISYSHDDRGTKIT